jgi:hypothetical protein
MITQINENNIFATGCSFTWGESLQFFSGLDSVVWKKDRPSFPDVLKTLDEPQLEFIRNNRWVAQLSNRLGVKYITQARNGGSNFESLLKTQYFYNNQSNVDFYKTFILQVTEFSRDPIIFKLPNGDVIPINDASIVNVEKEIFGLENDKIVYDSYTYFYDKLYQLIQKLELNNINSYIICYPKDAANALLKHKLNKYHTPLLYEENSYNSTDDLGESNPMLIVSNYFFEQNLNFGDNHLTINGHKIISDSIYTRIINTTK